MMSAMNITDTMINLGTMFTFALAGGACVLVGKGRRSRGLRPGASVFSDHSGAVCLRGRMHVHHRFLPA